MSGFRQDILHVSILLTFAACIGVYLILTTVVIAVDGVTFIDYARNLDSNFVGEINDNYYQHPGYPTMILCTRKIAGALCEGRSVLNWVHCAQSVALAFRLLTVVTLYFLGKTLVGSKLSFWGVLILVFLPDPAGYGSDALSDWPHLFFLAGGFLLLLNAAVHKRAVLFGFAGVAAGLGYLVRPECAQLLMYGGLWLVLQFFWPKRTSDRPKSILALVLLLIGFALVAGPYMKLKGAVFPKKNVGQFASNSQAGRGCRVKSGITPNTTCAADIVRSGISSSAGKLFQNIGETVMWFFVPALFVGLHGSLKRPTWLQAKQFFVIVLIVTNVPLMIWLHAKYGYLSRRHTLPLVIFTIFYIPVGLQALALWLHGKFPKNTEQSYFLVLSLIGISICIPKLLKPLHYDKSYLRQAARWLDGNTKREDVIAVPDVRIAFYANRPRIKYKDDIIPAGAAYVVEKIKAKDGAPIGEKTLSKDVLFHVTDSRKDSEIIIYRNAHR